MIYLKHKYLQTHQLIGFAASHAPNMSIGSIALLPNLRNAESVDIKLLKMVDSNKFIQLDIAAPDDTKLFFQAIIFGIEESKKIDLIVAENTMIWLDSIFTRMLEKSLTK